MPFQQAGSVRYFTFGSLDAEGVCHGVFTRQGGVSPAPWQALNVGGTVGDEADNVAENRRRAFVALGRDPATLFDVWQVHSAEVAAADAPRPPGKEHQKADAILTTSPGVSLFMRFADCVPILLYDPIRKAVGLAHAGWMGTVKQVAAAAVTAMQEQYRTNPADLIAAIGPSIAAHHYPVGEEVVDQVARAFGQDAASLLISHDGEVQFDLWAANQLVLENAGVRRVEVAGICTACFTDDWYSHRAEKGLTGRFGALIALKD
jgi:polyphenol oxidase